MQHILDLISNDRYIQHQARQFLHAKWPQLNETTRISYTNSSTVYIADLQLVNVFVNTIRVAISGWRRLRGVAMTPTLKELDNPEKRTKYSHRLYGAIVRAPMYLFWRVVGIIFKRSDWYMRGTEIQPNPLVNMPPINRREIRLERFGGQMDYAHYMHQQPQRTYFICGYDGATDTLYVYKH